MKSTNIFRLFINYIKDRIKSFLLFLSFSAVFAINFFLYNLSKEPLFYSFVLCLFLFLTFGIFDFCSYLKKYKAYENIYENLPLLYEDFPKPDRLNEKELQNIVIKLKEIFNENLNKSQREKQDNIDYYTTWIHQIKTPISVIKMILESEDTEENHKLLSELFRIEQYAEMALSYLRLNSDSSDYVFREYSLDDIIKEAIHKYAPQFINRRINLKYEPCDIKILTDEKWLLFIIEQILSNCVKYSPNGVVTIEATPDKKLKISDTGIGIAPEDMPRIFEKGFTGYNGRSNKKATGLGLYLCKKTADKLSNKIYAESEVGKGTTIILDLNRDKLTVE